MSYIAKATDGWQSEPFESTGDAIEAAVEHYDLTENDFQTLWDELVFDNGRVEIEIQELES